MKRKGLSIQTRVECPYCGSVTYHMIGGFQLSSGLNLRAPAELVLCQSVEEDDEGGRFHGCGGTFVIRPNFKLEGGANEIGIEGERGECYERERNWLADHGQDPVFEADRFHWHQEGLRARVKNGGRVLTPEGAAAVGSLPSDPLNAEWVDESPDEP